MDWASQEATKIRPITRPSELEKTACRMPPTRAHLGDLSVAYWPTCWSSSDSRPTWSSDLDSGEPFCSSQTVRKMNRKNCRYSDCQFSATSVAKLDEVRYRPSETGGSPSVICCWLKSACPA